MTATELAAEFSSLDRGNMKFMRWFPAQATIEDIKKEIGTYHDRYFISESNLIRLKTSELVCILSDWGATNISQKKWDQFKKHMINHGYSIGQLRIFNINDGAQRRWEYCRQYNFVSAGGKPKYHTGMKNLEKGDLLFVCRVGEDLTPTQRGCVAFCRIISEQAIDVRNIQTPNGKLRDVLLDNGQTYHDTFCKGRKLPDMASEVEWIRLMEDSPVKTYMHLGLCVSRIAAIDFNNLTNAFEIPRADSDR